MFALPDDQRDSARTLDRWQGLVLGASFGLLILGVMLALYTAWLEPMGLLDPMSQKLQNRLNGFAITTVGGYVALGVFYSLFHSLLEEYYWRWFVHGELRKVLAAPLAILISSLGFAAHHVIVLALYFGWTSSATWFFSLCVAVGGAVWAWLYDRSQSLLAVWISHLLVDAGIFLVGYWLVRETLS